MGKLLTTRYLIIYQLNFLTKINLYYINIFRIYIKIKDISLASVSGQI